MRSYVIVYDSNDLIMCRGIYADHEKALGHLMLLMEEDAESWLENDYELTKSEDFYALESDTGYGWAREWNHKEPEICIDIHWYLLIHEEDEK